MHLFYMVIWLLIGMSTQNGTQRYFMDKENCLPNEVLTVDSAIIHSQAEFKHYKHGTQCTMVFKASQHMRLLIQLHELDIYRGLHGNCSEDYLKVLALDETPKKKEILGRACGELGSLAKNIWETDYGDVVKVEWFTSANTTAVKPYLGFKMQLTSFSTTKATTTGAPASRTTTSINNITESETFWFISMLGIIVISILGAIIAVIRRKHLERRDQENGRIQDCNNEDSDEAYTYNRQESMLSTGSASRNIDPPPEYDTALTCSSDPLPPSYSEVDFEAAADANGNRTSSSLLPDSPVFNPGDISPGTNSVFILDTFNFEDARTQNVEANGNKSRPPVRLFIPSESTISEEDLTAQL